jgi:ABC-type glycerol-3-phosphate transport system substrate-binding protein
VNSPEGRQALAALEIAQQRVLEGLMGPSQAVMALGEEMAALGIASSDDQAVICVEESTFRLALIDSAEFSEPIRHLLRDFSAVCPGIRVLVDEYDGDALLQSLFSGQTLQIQADLLLISKDTLLVMLNPADVLDAQPLFDTNFFQRFRPFAIEPMRRGSQLLGVPVNFSTQVLFFNRTLVRDPALTLADLRAQASAGLPIVLSTNLLDGAAWGVGAFAPGGGDDLTQWAAPITAWLDWLNQAKQLPNVTLVQTGEEQRQAFIEGRSAYFVGGPDDLLDMRIAMGSTNVGVTTLPSGETQARPWLTLNSLIFNSGSSSPALAGARRFTEYVTSLDAQQALLDDFFRMPVHSNVDTSSEPAAAVFIAQAQGATYDAGKVELFYVLALTSKLFNEALFGDIAVSQVAVAMPFLIDALVPAIQASHPFTMPLASGSVITDGAAAQTPYFRLSLSLPDISPVIADLNVQLAAALGTDIASNPGAPGVGQPPVDQNGIGPEELDTGTLMGVLAADALALVELVRAVPVPVATTFASGAEPETGATMFMLDPDAGDGDEIPPALEGTEITGTLPLTSPATLPAPAAISPTLTAPVTDTVTLPEPP